MSRPNLSSLIKKAEALGIHLEELKPGDPFRITGANYKINLSKGHDTYCATLGQVADQLRQLKKEALKEAQCHTSPS